MVANLAPSHLTPRSYQPSVHNYATIVKVADIYVNLCNVTSIVWRGAVLQISFVDGTGIALDSEQAVAFAKVIDNAAFDVMADHER